MKLPEFVYAKAFWEAATFAAAGILAVLAYFKVIDSTWAVSAGALLAWVLAVLRAFKIEPQLMERRARLLAAKKSAKKSK